MRTKRSRARNEGVEACEKEIEDRLRFILEGEGEGGRSVVILSLSLRRRVTHGQASRGERAQTFFSSFSLGLNAVVTLMGGMALAYNTTGMYCRQNSAPERRSCGLASARQDIQSVWKMEMDSRSGWRSPPQSGINPVQLATIVRACVYDVERWRKRERERDCATEGVGEGKASCVHTGAWHVRTEGSRTAGGKIDRGVF